MQKWLLGSFKKKIIEPTLPPGSFLSRCPVSQGSHYILQSPLMEFFFKISVKLPSHINDLIKSVNC